MQIDKKIYELLKMTKDFGFGIISVVTGLLIAFGVADNTVAIVSLCISSLCQLIVAFINAMSKNHWKAVAENGQAEDIVEVNE